MQCATCFFDLLDRVVDCEAIVAVSFFSPLCLAKSYSKMCPTKLIGSCLLGTQRYNFLLYTPTMGAKMHSATDGETDRQTDRRHYDAKSRSYCVHAVQ